MRPSSLCLAWGTGAGRAPGRIRTCTLAGTSGADVQVELVPYPDIPGALVPTARQSVKVCRRPQTTRLVRLWGAYANRYPKMRSPTCWFVTSVVFACSRANLTAFCKVTTRSRSSLTRFCGRAPENLTVFQ